jgi:hypothetical protein
MSTLTTLARLEQRQALRRRLFLQRLRIGHLLTPQIVDGNQFPRSMTMRLLTHRPAMAMRIVSQAALMLFGPRILSTLSGALLLAKLLRYTATDQRQLPPPNNDL